jgi:branched-chain amino acid transport system permease protein
MTPLLQALINGLLLGGIYAAFSAGFSLIFGVMGVVNIANGEMVMIGAFITYFLFDLFKLDPFLTLPFSLGGLFVLGYLLQRLVINRVIGAPPIMSYIMTFGIHLTLANLALLAWSADPRIITTSYSGANFSLGGITLPVVQFVTFILAFVIIGGLYILLYRTKIGRAIQATAQDREMARLMGISVHQVYAVTFGLGAAVTGLSGSLIAAFRHVETGMGLPYTIMAFCVVVVGGMGYIPGALVGGLILGVISSVTTHLFTAGWSIAITFFLLYLILLFRPQGILGKGILE